VLFNSDFRINFTANLKSPKLRFRREDFFVNIKGYGRDLQWARQAKDTADTAVMLIRKDTDAENVLKFISAGVRKANSCCESCYKRENSGVLRINRDGWLSEGKAFKAFTPYIFEKYLGYAVRLNKLFEAPLLNPIKRIDLTRPYDGQLKHGDALYINNALDYVFKLSKKIFPKYVHKDIKAENLDDVNSTIAEIRWVLAHSTPWKRGSDAISNIFMRALYKSIGIKTYPLKKSVSLDLEAYCTELSDYKKLFPTYFEKIPEIVD